ncbi:hypothetical protein [Ornithobacterium rhinotracheale]|uniref:Aminoacyl-tRNA synthetase class I anticodon-binding domain-containing protein n=2 Tax=Ornithobacterium rhinotracheale TaxID=28251 RepID=I4A024_ORNRL|nr:hypothetical protein [Ornithobacterium rhinotracheale]AFL97308.1 hypothetical protein Ornrh_1121 [Ornithobacterium rhinotracheale DSM 15997]MCK0194199.1 hypothetical protein [Ornithobacterium rhinotracheale]MCK0199752.1 hypothetical protein [Ornithobacterium rhinotracheale]UOH64278.1 hypothetical protein MT993_03445 [Ornithobacterium rhinotracheale]UOH65660.1 hypothetical protein MT999_10755 [Ornithobacterium rhinotracheale]
MMLNLIQHLIKKASKIENYNVEEIHHAMQDFVNTHEIGFGKIMMSLLSLACPRYSCDY